MSSSQNNATEEQVENNNTTSSRHLMAHVVPREHLWHANFLYVVWYRPIARGAPRHWALFLASGDAHTSVGTIYQVVNDREAPYLKGEMLNNKQASAAGRYEGSKLITIQQITKADMDQHFHAYGEPLASMIHDHNRDMNNIHCQSNCQNWVMYLAGSITNHVDFRGVPT